MIRERISGTHAAEERAWKKLTELSDQGSRSVVAAGYIENEDTCFRAEAIANLRAWERYGWGKMVLGRRGKDTRIMLKPDICTRIQHGSSERIEQIIDSPLGDSSKDQLGNNPITHFFHLRDNMEATFILPADLTDREAGRLARFIEALPI